MLEVGVHDADPRRAGRAHALDHRAAEARRRASSGGGAPTSIGATRSRPASAIRGVSSSLSSTKMISVVGAGHHLLDARPTSSSMLSTSLRVGMTSETAGIWSPA